MLEKINPLSEVEIPSLEARLKEVKEEMFDSQTQTMQRRAELASQEHELSEINKRLETVSTYARELESRIREQNGIRQKVLEERALLDERIQSKIAEKQRAEETLKQLSEVGLSQQAAQLKLMQDELMRLQSDVQTRQTLLENLLREIPVQQGKLKSLQTQEKSLKEEYLASEQAVKELQTTLNRLEDEITQRRSQVQQQERLIAELESSLSRYPQLLDRVKTSRKLLEFELAEHQRDVTGLKRDHLNQGKVMRDLKELQKSLEPVSPWVQAWRNFFWLLLILFFLSLLGFTVWFALLKKMF